MKNIPSVAGALILLMLMLGIASCAQPAMKPQEEIPDPGALIEGTEYPINSAIAAISAGMSTEHLQWPDDQVEAFASKIKDDEIKAARQLIRQSELGMLGHAVVQATGNDQGRVELAVKEIRSSAKRHGVPPALLAAVIHTESSFIPQARSKSGAVGLSQIMPRYWRKECPKLATIAGNVDCGAMVLSYYYELSGGAWPKALAYYNVGPKNYKQSSRLRSIGQGYAEKVLESQRGIETALASLNP